MILYEAYEMFLVDKAVENCTDQTVSNYKYMLRYFVDYVGFDVDVSSIVELDTVKRYVLHLKDKGVTGKTIHTYIKHVKVFYRWLVNNGLIEYNAVADLKIRYEKRIPQILSMDEIRILMNTLNLRDRVMVMIVLDCGLRKAELTNLHVPDIEQDRIFVRSGKGRKDRVVPLSTVVHQLIQEYIVSRPVYTDYLFQCHGSSDALSYSGVRCVFRRLKDKTGIERLCPHLLRHTYGTYYINSGGDIKVLQLLLGHSEVQTTETYIHLSNMLNVGNYAKHSIINILNQKEGG